MENNPPRKDNDNIPTWNGPSTQNDANAYIQHVQNFWTDERLAGAVPRPMPNTDSNNADNNGSSGSGDEVKK